MFFLYKKKSISVKEDYNLMRNNFARSNWNRSYFLLDSWWIVKGVLANLESQTYKYVTTDLNTITKIFFSRKIKKLWKLLETSRFQENASALGNAFRTSYASMDLWIHIYNPYTTLAKLLPYDYMDPWYSSNWALYR